MKVPAMAHLCPYDDLSLRPPQGVWEPRLHKAYAHCAIGAIPSQMSGGGVLMKIRNPPQDTPIGL